MFCFHGSVWYSGLNVGQVLSNVYLKAEKTIIYPLPSPSPTGSWDCTLSIVGGLYLHDPWLGALVTGPFIIFHQREWDFPCYRGETADTHVTSWFCKVEDCKMLEASPWESLDLYLHSPQSLRRGGRQEIGAPGRKWPALPPLSAF